MAQANDSVLVTPGSGATIATHLVNSKEYQVVMLAHSDGQLIGDAPRYVINIPSQVFVASANTVHWDLFNGDGSLIVRVLSIRHVPDMVTAVATGVATNWLLERSTTVGTGGSTITPWLPDLDQTVLDTDITCRSKPAGGAAASTDLINYQVHGEETNTGTVVAAALGGLEIIPAGLLPENGGRGIMLRPSQGMRCVQVTSTALGNAGWNITFSVE